MKKLALAFFAAVVLLVVVVGIGVGAYYLFTFGKEPSAFVVLVVIFLILATIMFSMAQS